MQLMRMKGYFFIIKILNLIVSAADYIILFTKASFRYGVKNQLECSVSLLRFCVKSGEILRFIIAKQ